MKQAIMLGLLFGSVLFFAGTVGLERETRRMEIEKIYVDCHYMGDAAACVKVHEYERAKK